MKTEATPTSSPPQGQPPGFRFRVALDGDLWIAQKLMRHEDGSEEVIDQSGLQDSAGALYHIEMWVEEMAWNG